MIVSHAVHVLMSAPQEQSLRAKSIQLTLIPALSAVLAQTFVLLRQSVFPLNSEIDFFEEKVRAGTIGVSPSFKPQFLIIYFTFQELVWL